MVRCQACASRNDGQQTQLSCQLGQPQRAVCAEPLVAGSSSEQDLNAVCRSVLNAGMFPHGIEWVPKWNSSEFPEIGEVIEDSDASDVNELGVHVVRRRGERLDRRPFV